MSDDGGAGCLSALILLALLWVPFHFSGHAVLYWREEGTMKSGELSVECKYINSTGAESTFRFFASPAWREAFYCPRTKKVGE